MGKKDKGTKAYKDKMNAKKEKRQQQMDDANYRDQNERREETLQVIYQLQKNNIDSKFDAIQTLLSEMTDYVINGNEKDFSIPFPEMNKVIKGQLYLHKDKQCVVVMKHV